MRDSMNKKLCTIFAIQLLLMILSGCIFNQDSGALLISQEKHDKSVVEIDNFYKIRVSQSFKVNAEKITKAEFLPVGDGWEYVILSVREGGIEGKELSRMEKRINETERSAWDEWDFPDVKIDSNKEYFFVFRCPDCKNVGCPAEDNFPCDQSHLFGLKHNKQDNYPDGSYWLNNRKKEGDIAFRVYGLRG